MDPTGLTLYTPTSMDLQPEKKHKGHCYNWMPGRHLIADVVIRCLSLILVVNGFIWYLYPTQGKYPSLLVLTTVLYTWRDGILVLMRGSLKPPICSESAVCLRTQRSSVPRWEEEMLLGTWVFSLWASVATGSCLRHSSHVGLPFPASLIRRSVPSTALTGNYMPRTWWFVGRCPLWFGFEGILEKRVRRNMDISAMPVIE